MAYSFLGGGRGYNYDTLKMEVYKFDELDKVQFNYNDTYIYSIKNVDWKNLSSDIEEKIDFLSRWNTTIVRANKDKYRDLFRSLGEKHDLITELVKFGNFEITNNFDSVGYLSTSVEYVYDILDEFLGPTTASKVLHMYNPNFFPIWDEGMRKYLFNFRAHKPSQYWNLILMMRTELNIVIEAVCADNSINRDHATEKIKDLDAPTYNLLRVLDKVNYNNSRKHHYPDHIGIHNHAKGGDAMYVKVGGKENTGLKLSDFIKDILPSIYSFSMNKKGGFTYDEEASLWRQGKITAAFLKQVASMLDYPTFQVSNYDLLNSLKRDRNDLLKVLSEKPHLDKTIVIKSKGGGSGGGTLRSGLLQ